MNNFKANDFQFYGIDFSNQIRVIFKQIYLTNKFDPNQYNLIESE